jgi:VanZ family protein
MRMARLRSVDPWLPPLLLMGLIFFLSAQPSLNSGLGLADQIGRKVVHFAEYALLAHLWWRALRTKLSADAAMLAALAIASAYAATDEFHQTFVAGRHGTPVDWLIDTAGAATAMVRVRIRTRRKATA